MSESGAKRMDGAAHEGGADEVGSSAYRLPPWASTESEHRRVEGALGGTMGMLGVSLTKSVGQKTPISRNLCVDLPTHSYFFDAFSLFKALRVKTLLAFFLRGTVISRFFVHPDARSRVFVHLRE